MNFYRAMLAAVDGCTVYMGELEDGEEPKTIDFSGGSILITPDMITADWHIARKWRKTAEGRAMTMLAEGQRVETDIDGKRAEVRLAEGMVIHADTGEPLPMELNREWRVLR